MSNDLQLSAHATGLLTTDVRAELGALPTGAGRGSSGLLGCCAVHQPHLFRADLEKAGTMYQHLVRILTPMLHLSSSWDRDTAD